MAKQRVLIVAILVISFLFMVCTGCENQNAKVEVRKENGMVLIPSGTLNMGGDNVQADKNEFPKHQVAINVFWMDETEVTNKQFSEFVNATNYITIAERPIVWEEIKKTLPPNTHPYPVFLSMVYMCNGTQGYFM